MFQRACPGVLVRETSAYTGPGKASGPREAFNPNPTLKLDQVSEVISFRVKTRTALPKSDSSRVNIRQTRFQERRSPIRRGAPVAGFAPGRRPALLRSGFAEYLRGLPVPQLRNYLCHNAPKACRPHPARTSPYPLPSTSNKLLEVLRRGSGEDTARSGRGTRAEAP